MSDVLLQHGGLDQAEQDLQQASSQVIQQMDELVSGLQPLAASFSGQAADAFHAFCKTVSAAESQMQTDLTQAVQALQAMHDNHRYADTKGSQTFSH
jgi:WXG100 family type VII secretion target